ncbi:MAG: hypothetical protein HOV68_33745 [Streptomycetaceae bacterium]|nr:hypothetical protein [Streptomycetaceae bacterium]
MPARRKPPKDGKQGELAAGLRELVYNAGTVREIANRVSVSRATLYAVLAGDRLPTSHLVMTLVPECRGIRLFRGVTVDMHIGAETRRWLALLTEARAERDLVRGPTVRRAPVDVGRLPEEEALTEAIRAELERAPVDTEHWQFTWPRELTPGRVERYRTGRTVPSPENAKALMRLLYQEPGLPKHDLVALAVAAKRARVTARRRAREGRLQPG